MRPETVDTTAATAGSSRQSRSQNLNPMAATVEDYDNDKDEQNINPLTKDSKELLLLEEGKMEIPRKIRDKTAKKQLKMTVKDEKRHVKSKSSTESTENEWVTDPRMPQELNELASLVWKSQS